MTVLKVRPFRLLVVSFLIVQTANALTAGLTVLFIAHVIGLPGAAASSMTGLLFLSSALFLPIWIILSKRFDKKRAWMASLFVCALALAAAFLLGPGQIAGIVALCVVVGACFGCDAIMPTSMLADIVFDFEQRGESRLAGVFLALKNSVSKLAFIVPMAVAFPVLDLVGFDSSGANPPETLFTLTLFFAGVPILLRALAFVILARSAALPFRGIETAEKAV